MRSYSAQAKESCNFDTYPPLLGWQISLNPPRRACARRPPHVGEVVLNLHPSPPARGGARGGGCNCLHASSTTVFLSTPISGTSTSSLSPGFSHCGGV